MGEAVGNEAFVSLKDVAEAAAAGLYRREVARTKFRNVKVTVDGITFDSKWEAARWSQLRLEEKAGTIRRLIRQRPFAITVNDFPVCTYVADFVYEREVPFASGASWQTIVEDAKGMRTEMYRLKKKLMRAVLGVEILETRARKKSD
jgi:hypothetical protein